MRMITRFGLMAMVACLPAFYGCATPDGDSGYGQGEPTDRDIAREVMDRLRMDDLTSRFTIGVSAEDGIVTLTGPVVDAGARLRAVGIAQGASGVKGVIDSMTRF